MSGEKKIIEDLKKYNMELENFLPNVKFDYVEQLVSMNKGKTPDTFDEYFSLLGTNVIDLRTEVALLRKNLTNDIESMVLREVDEAQKIFVNKVNEVNARAIMDMKSGLSEHMAELHSEVSDIKKEFSRLKDYNSSLKELFMKFNSDMIGLKSDLINVAKMLKGTGFDNMRKSIDSITQRVDLMDRNYKRELENSHEKRFSNDIIRINPGEVSNFNDVLVDNRFFDENSQDMSKVEKILDIDRKIKKLDTLR